MQVTARQATRSYDRAVTTRFRPGRRVVVYVDLSASCDGVACPTDQACHAGGCVVIPDLPDPVLAQDGGSDGGTCASDTECGGRSCDLRTRTCVDCLSITDCGADERCSASTNRCEPGRTPGTVCVPDTIVTTGGGAPWLAVGPGTTALTLAWAWRSPSDRKVCPYVAGLDPISGTRAGAETRVADVTMGGASFTRISSASDGGRLIGWNNASGTPSTLTRVDAAGTPSLSTSLPSALPIPPVAIALADTTYGVAWTDNRTGSDQIFFAQFLIGGGLIGTERQVSESIGTAAYPALVWTGSEYGVAWHDLAADGNQEIYFARVDTNGMRVGEPLRVTNDPALSAVPSLAWSGSEYGLLWWDARSGSRQLFFRRLDATGAEIDDEAQITVGVGDQANPVLVWGGSDYGLAWNDGTSVYFSRIDAAGAPFGRTLSLGAGRAPSIAFVAGGFSVAWENPAVPGVHYARVCP